MKKIYQILWLLFLALFSLGQLQRLQLSPRVAFYGHDLILLSWLSLSVFTHRPAWKSWFKKFSQNKLYLLFGGWVILGLVIHLIFQGWTLAPLLYIARLIIYSLAVISLNFIKPFTKVVQKKLWVGVSLLIASWGLAQYLLLPDVRFLRYFGWDDHYYRLIGTFFDPNFTGLFLVMSLFLLAKLKQRPWLKKLGILWLCLAIALTYSRATYLSLFISSTILLWLETKDCRSVSRWLYLCVMLVLLSLPFLPKPGGEGVNLLRTYTASSRLESTQGALTQLKPYQWVVGRGWFVPFESGVLPLVDTAHFPDNLVVFSLASTGIVGLGLISLILWRWGYKLYKQDIFIFSAFVAVIIHSQVNHSLWQPFIFLYLLNLSHLALKPKT